MRISLVAPSISDGEVVWPTLEFYRDSKCLSFPNLTKLCVIHEDEVGEVHDHGIDDPGTWLGTSPRVWSSSPHIPEVITNGTRSLSSSFRTAITKLTLNLDTVEHVEDFGRRLASFEAVRELSIRILHDGGLAGSVRTQATQWQMPNVAVLDLEVEVAVPLISHSADDFETLLNCVQFPNVTDLQIQITTRARLNLGPSNTCTSRLKHILLALLYGNLPDRVFRFPATTSFGFQMHGPLSCLAVDWLLPLHEFHEIRHIHVKGMPMTLFPSDPCAPPHLSPTLRSIKLEDCDNVTTEGLSSFLETVRALAQEHGKEECLEEVTVVRCGAIDMAKLVRESSSKRTKFFWVL